MWWPERLYQLLAKDAGASGPRLRSSGELTTSGAAATQTLSFINDAAQMLMLGSVTLAGFPGAAQNYVNCLVTHRDQSNNVMSVIASDSVAAGAVVTKYVTAYPQGVVIPPRHAIVFTMTFNAGANSNQLNAYFQGVLTPTGSLLF